MIRLYKLKYTNLQLNYLTRFSTRSVDHQEYLLEGLNQNMSDIDISYLSLLSSTIESMEERNPSIVLLTVDAFNVSPSDMSVVIDSLFDRNFTELVLIPTSTSPGLNREVLDISVVDANNIMDYKKLLSNDKLRNACVKYVHAVLDESQDTIFLLGSSICLTTTTATLVDILQKRKPESITTHDLHKLLAIFLNLILVEVTFWIE